MSDYSIKKFLADSEQKDRNQGVFELESNWMLEVNLNGEIWTKMGSMVAYRGKVKFEREGILEHGLGRLLKKTFTGESVMLTKATGNGKVYLADNGKQITILKLENESLFVNGNDLLAFEKSVVWDIKMMRRVSGMMAGGLFNVKLEGSGMVAITTNQAPLTLRVTPDNPLITDPNATVAWSGSLSPEIRTDITMKTLFGRGSGESIQMLFQGEGFVVIQPYEEVYFQRQ